MSRVSGTPRRLLACIALLAVLILAISGYLRVSWKGPNPLSGDSAGSVGNATPPRPPDPRSRVWRSRVLCEEGNEGIPVPIAHARIQVLNADHQPGPLVSTTDRDGRFELSIPSSTARFVARVSADGYETDEERISPEALPETLYLSATQAVSGGEFLGTVRDAVDQRPIQGAEVKLEGTAAATAVTGADGGFKLDLKKTRVPQSGVPLQIGHPGYAPATISPAVPGKPYDIALFREILVRGTVRGEDGAAIPGARIQMVRCPHPEHHRTGIQRKSPVDPAQQNPLGSAETDNAGAFQMSVPGTPSDICLSATATGYVRAASPCLVSASGGAVPPAGLSHAFVLNRARSVRGRVQTAEGKGVPGALLTIRPPKDDPSWYFGTLKAYSGADGEFTFSQLAAAPYHGSVGAGSGALALKPREFDLNGASQDFVTIVLEPVASGKLRIRIHNRSLAEGDLTLVIHALSSPGQDPVNGFALPPESSEGEASVPSGTYVVLAYAPGAFGASGTVQVVEGQSASMVDLKLERGATLTLLTTGNSEAKQQLPIQIEWWDNIRNDWIELSNPEVPDAAADPSKERKLRIPVPAGRVRLRRGNKILREVTCSASEQLDLGRISD
jgi:hypothetical protein